MRDPSDDAALGQWFDDLDLWGQGQNGPSLSGVLRYGDDPEQEIDVWGDETKAGNTALVCLHGGYFLGPFGRRLQNTFVRACAARGFTVYNVEYRREGCGGDLYVTTADVRAAVDHIAARHDPARLAVIGHSAGGYLGLTVADHPAVELVLALGSVCDLSATVRSGLDEGAVVKWLGATPDTAPDIYAAADLMARQPCSARQILFHGIEDRVVDISQSQDFDRLSRASGSRTELVRLPGEGHFCFLDPREAAFQTVMARLAHWRSAG
jgi:acetyl esterase/lipase